MPNLFKPNIAHSGDYRPDIDGLRAIAVLSVLFFHANVPGFSGGYVGVDIFFVISGYLISSLILKAENGSGFSFLDFYERRVRRIFPALFAVLFACVLTSAVLFAPEDFEQFGKSIVATTLFGSNFYFVLTAHADGYFNSASDSQPLLHTWSLSVEEQFYLFFPAILIVIVRLARQNARFYLLAITLLSFLINVWTTKHRPILAFYILLPRAWELLVGALLAMKALPPLKSRALREAAELAGLGLIAYAVAVFTKETPFPGLAAAFPCLGAALILYAGEDGPSTLKLCLALPPVVFVGLISYSLYLWHWPLLAFTRYFMAGELNASITAMVLLASVCLAFLSYEFVELPIRNRRLAITRHRLFALGAAVSLVTIAFGIVAWAGKGLPQRYDARTLEIVTSNTERKSDFQEVCGNWKKQINSVDDISFCNLGPADSKKILFLGDSHVQQLYPLLKKFYGAASSPSRGAILAITNGCVPVEHFNYTGKGYYCDDFATYAMIRAEQPDIDTVFIGFNTWWASHPDSVCEAVNGRCIQTLSIEDARRRVFGQLSEQMRQLKANGKRVILTLPFPMYDKLIPQLEIRNAVFGRLGLAGTPTDMTLPVVRDEMVAIAKNSGAEIFDPRASLCDAHGCATELNGISIYKDDNHLVASRIEILESNLKQALEAHTADTAAAGAIAINRTKTLCSANRSDFER